MINFPASTRVNRTIAKEKFYNKTTVDSKLRQLFTSEVERITWTNKIAPDTLNISAKEYLELQIFEISLKGLILSMSILKHIDTFIPYPILFILKREGASKAVLSFKEPLSKNINQMKVDSYFETDWKQDLNLEIEGLSVDEIYMHFLAQIQPDLAVSGHVTTKDAVSQNKERVALQKQIDSLNQQIRIEISESKRQELARKRHEVESIINGIITPKNIRDTELGEI